MPGQKIELPHSSREKGGQRHQGRVKREYVLEAGQEFAFSRTRRMLGDEYLFDAGENGTTSASTREIGDTGMSSKKKRVLYLRPNLFCFFSAGFRIWNEHSKLSSTLIIAPALSNSPQ